MLTRQDCAPSDICLVSFFACGQACFFFLCIFPIPKSCISVRSNKQFVCTTASISAFLDRKSCTANAVLDTMLLVLCVLCNLLLVLLFASVPASHLDSLLYIQRSNTSPVVVVGLTTAVPSRLTSALVTRAVEYISWLNRTLRSIRKNITVGEMCRLAQWFVSLFLIL